MFKFDLGYVLKDKITGFKGVVMGRSDYVTGCRQYALSPQKPKDDGSVPDWVWLDEGRLEYANKKRVMEPFNEALDDNKSNSSALLAGRGAIGGPSMPQGRYK